MHDSTKGDTCVARYEPSHSSAAAALIAALGHGASGPHAGTRRLAAGTVARSRWPLPIRARRVEGGVAGACHCAAPAGACGARAVAVADAHAAQRRRARLGGARGLHGRARVLRERARLLRHRQPLSTHRAHRQVAGCAVAARPLAWWTVSGHRGARAACRACIRRRAVRQRRTPHPPGPRRAAGADGCRRVPVRHGRVRRQRADPAGDRAQRARSHARRPRRRAVLRRRGRTAPPLDSRAADLERRARARLPHCVARRRPGAHRGNRRQRRRHADLPARRNRRSTRGGVSRRDGLGAHAGRLHL